MAKFRIPPPTTPKPESPAILFRDLKRDASIKFLWDHQARLLDEYHAKHLSTHDLAIELPTGSGKTLVALLIAEYRRRAFNERVVFLCPTRQLCSQVAAQTRNYGVQPSLLVGKQRDYDPAAFFAYQQAKAVAITTYSGVFNTNPAIDDAELIICDDAHAADNYVSSMWTVTITTRNAAAFAALYQVLKPELSENVVHRIENHELGSRSGLADLISSIATHHLHPQIRDALDALSEGEDWGYPWSKISQHLDACSIYCSGDIFEIRPVISPALTHSPFASAKQRLYMSATLGEDGDIERSFGVKKIARLPIPPGWDKRGTGRRLVLFPGYGLDDETTWETVAALCREAGRALILVPDDRTRERLKQTLGAVFPVLGATDVEQSLDPFTKKAEPSVLIVANRWEGIDLPGEDCRLLALVSLPTSAGLQERFMMERLGAISQLRDRIRTRVTQAMGRCTRDEADYAIVLMIGSDLLKWCCTQTNIAGMHPELQAEIAFGLENSEGRTKQDFIELCQALLQRTEDWTAAESGIIDARNNRPKQADPAAATLAQVAPLEIAFADRMWNAEFAEAFGCATRVVEGLAGGSDLKPYRSFWHHQAAVAAFLAFKATKQQSFKANCIEHLEAASTTSIGIRWLSTLRAQLLAKPVGEVAVELPVREWFRQINDLLTLWNIKGGRFDRELADARRILSAPEDAKNFERGLEVLGQMLGARTHRWDDDGAPDGLWIFEDWCAFVFEAKHEKAKAVPLKTVRQARTHEERVRKDNLIPKSMPCTTVVASVQTILDPTAEPHAGELRHIEPARILAIFDRAATALRQVRAQAVGVGEEALQTEAETLYRTEKIFMEDVAEELERVQLASLPVARQ